MKRQFLLIGCLCLSVIAHAEAFAHFGVDSVGSAFIRDYYQYGDLVHYLDNYSDYVTYEAETTGEWNMPDQMLFSVNGNSYRWNRYYINGFRTDSRVMPGSTMYYLNMDEHSMHINYLNSSLFFTTDSVRDSRLRLSNNVGYLGGVNPSTEKLINLYHKSAAQRTEGLPTDLTLRNHIKGAFRGEATYGIPAFGRRFYQHVYAQAGTRQVVAWDQNGSTGYYNAPFYKVQLDGDLPLPNRRALDYLKYYIIAQRRTDMFGEFVYNANEVATQKTHTAAVYAGKDWGSRGALVTGLSYALNDIRHNETAFDHNICDQDGEGMEPWYADGKTHELNWSVRYNCPLFPWLKLDIDAYNSFLHFTPTTAEWSNAVYWQGYHDAERTGLYRIDWHSSAFNAGMLENEVALVANHRFNARYELQARLAATLDGVCLRDGRSVISPNWEAMIGVHITPVKWFMMDISLAHYRERYSWDDVLFLSPDYMNGEVRYAGTETLLTTTGGRYHKAAKNLMQPSYVSLDLPFRFQLDSKHGHHEFSFLLNAKLYYDQWVTQFDQAPEAYGTMVDDVFFMNEGEKNYVVTRVEDSFYPENWMVRLPYFLNAEAKYTYTAKRFFFAFSWQNFLLNGPSTFSNGAKGNQLGTLSESTANPNICINTKNPVAWGMNGRIDQDRSFAARLQIGWNITDELSLAVTGKFRDGTPFATYATRMHTTAAGTQMAVIATDSRGINMIDQHFGKRKDAFFNFDLRLRYQGQIKQVPFEIQATCYNVYDFGTELYEYCFDDYQEAGHPENRLLSRRAALTLNVPRGMLLSLTVGLEKKH